MPNLDGMDTTTNHQADRDAGPAAAGSPATASLAVANCFLVVDDHEKALTFYRDVLGFTVTKDVSMGEFRWLSVATPHPARARDHHPVGRVAARASARRTAPPSTRCWPRAC